MASLTANDARVLSTLFDTDLSLSSQAQILSTAKGFPHIREASLHNIQHLESTILRPLAAESPDLETISAAISSLGDLIQANPEYAPAYVNRAQAERMLLGDRKLAIEERNAISRIHQDLSEAIHLAQPTEGELVLSQLQAKTLAAAYTHRGHLYLHIARYGELSCLPAQLGTIGTQTLEEYASADFAMGGRYGDPVAKQLSVRTNPYAKMCGAIVREALQKDMQADL